MPKALTTLEMIISVAIISVVFAAMLPQFTNINNSWASRQENLQIVQTGRITISHLRNNLSTAVKILAVSDPAETNGFIEYEDITGTAQRYELLNGFVSFGPVGNLALLADSVSNLQFTCYALDDLDTAITDAAKIRMVKVAATMASGNAATKDKEFLASAYLYSNSDQQQEIIIGEISDFGITTGNTPVLAQIDASRYLCVYTGPSDDGHAVVLTVDVALQKVSKGISFEYDATNGEAPSLIRIDAQHFLCTYQGAGNDGWAVVLTVSPVTFTVTSNTPVEFEPKLGVSSALARIDQNHFLCAYEGDGSDGFAQVMTIDTTTWDIILGMPFEFDTSMGRTPALEKINDRYYLCAYQGSSGGYATVLTVNPAGWTVSKNATFQFDPDNGGTPDLARISANRYLCAYAGAGDDGWAVVLGVNPIGWAITRAVPFEYEIYAGKGPSLVQLPDTSEYLCSYMGSFQYLWANVLVVNTTDWSISQKLTTQLLGNQTMEPDLIKIDDDNYLCAYEDRTNDGWAAILKIDSAVKP